MATTTRASKMEGKAGKIHEPHNHFIYFPPIISGYGSDGGSHDYADSHRNDPYQQGYPRPVHNPGPYIPPELIGPQNMFPSRTLQPVGQILFQRIMDLDPRAQNGNYHHRSNHEDSQESQTVPFQVPPTIPPEGPPFFPLGFHPGLGRQIRLRHFVASLPATGLFEGDPGIQNRVEKINQKVDKDKKCGNQKNRGLNHQVIPCQYRFDQKLTHSRPTEYHFDNHASP